MEARISTDAEFIRLSVKFLFINYNGPGTESNVDELNMLLNDLNSLDYKRQQITDTRAVLRLIESLANLPTDEDTIIVKACWLLKALINRQNLLLSFQQRDILLKWLCKCLDNCFYSILCDALGVIQILFKGSLDCIMKYNTRFLSTDGILSKLLENPYYWDSEKTIDTNSPHEIYLSCMLCIEAIVATTSVDKPESDKNLVPLENLDNIGNLILSILYDIDVKNYSDINYYIMITSSINCLKFIAYQNNTWCTLKLGEILGVTKAFLMYGLPDTQITKPQKIVISQQAILDPQSVQQKTELKIMKPRKTRTSQQRQKKKKSENKESAKNSFTSNVDKMFLEFNIFTSDSDFSENELRRAQIDLHKQAKLRFSVLSLISTISQTVEKRILFGYWHSLFPYENLQPTTASLLNSVLKDPSSRCRMTALQAISFMLQNSKPFLFQAETNDKTSTFTPFSVALGNMITAMYEVLTQALFNESDSSVQTQMLKCFSIFIQATPFHRLKPGIVTGFVKYMRYLVRHKNPNLKVGALMVMSCLLSTSEITPEISEIYGSSNLEYKKLNDVKNVNEIIEIEYDDEELAGPDEEEDIDDSEKKADGSSNCDNSTEESIKDKSYFHISWVLQAALENLGVTVSQFVRPPINNYQTVRMECLQVLLVMSAHFTLLKNHLQLIAAALINSFSDIVPDIQLYGAKVIDALGQAINNHLVTEDSVKLEEFTTFYDFWQTIIPHVLQQIQNLNLNSKQRAACCDCMANIGVYIYEKLPHNQQIQIISIMSGCACDSNDVAVQGAAVRALSIYSLFPSLKNDMCFIENTTESCIKLMKSSNLSIRITASWSLGNIVDTLANNMNTGELLQEKINDKIFEEILEINITASSDNDKVRSNVMRMIGNLLRLFNKDYLTKSNWSNSCLKLIETLISNALNCNDFKVKWNACHAIGNFMKNPSMFDDSFRNKWQTIVYPALCNIISNLSNFKVGINAASALSIPGNRNGYGSNYLRIWSAALTALDQSNNHTDFNEYKHRDNLQEQLCILLAHLMNIAGPSDVVEMNNVLIPLFETSKQNWYRVNNRILPEKSTLLLIKLSDMLKISQLNTEQKSAILHMNACFEIVENF